jgi:hypothetical protein
MKTLAIDFDGVIHAYSRGWEGGAIYDEPVPGVAEALALLALDYRLVVFTARDLKPPEAREIGLWLYEHGLTQYIAEVTNEKPKAWAYIDDRAIRFESWKQALDSVEGLAVGDTWRADVAAKATYHHEESEGTLGTDPGRAS